VSFSISMLVKVVTFLAFLNKLQHSLWFVHFFFNRKMKVITHHGEIMEIEFKQIIDLYRKLEKSYNSSSICSRNFLLEINQG
jgi:hypothetical protein